MLSELEWFLLTEEQEETPQERAAADDAVIAAHVAACRVDGFCYMCQCL